jgi:hypothetical protein
MSFLYTAYGLTIASELPLPELLPGAGHPNVTFHLGAVARLPDEVGRSGDFVRAAADEVVFFWEGLGVFRVHQGHTIIIEPCADVDADLLRAFLLGSALGVLLHQRGLLTLHASAVAIADSAVAFIGWKGQGKSTTATAFQAHGHRLLTDDIIALDLTMPDTPVVYPGFPQIKLRPDAAAALFDQPELLPRLHPEIDKLAHRPRATFALEPLPLRAIFMLDQGTEPAVTAVSPAEAFVALISHSYALRFIKTAGATPTHFEQSRQLAACVPLWRLQRPYGLDALPEIIRLVEAQVTGQPVLV